MIVNISFRKHRLGVIGAFFSFVYREQRQKPLRSSGIITGMAYLPSSSQKDSSASLIFLCVNSFTIISGGEAGIKFNNT